MPKGKREEVVREGEFGDKWYLSLPKSERLSEAKTEVICVSNLNTLSEDKKRRKKCAKREAK
jgi:hypothetical protein